MHEKTKVGVFGVGSLGQWHARIYSEFEGADLVGVHDIDKNRANEIADKYNTKAFATVEDLAKEIEAASVVVPTEGHFELSQKLADHDINLLVEKPMASNTLQAEEMVKYAKEKGLILQVGHVERFNPVMQFLEEQLATPQFIEAIRLASYPPPRDGNLPRGTDVSVVLDLMIHDLEIILHLVKSPVKEIHATGVAVLSSAEDIANARLSFENGCVANVTASRISMEKMRKIRVFQRDTYLSLDYMNQTGQLCKKTGMTIESTEVPIEKDEPLKLELESFIDCVKNKHDPIVSGKHASEALKLAIEICQHIRENPS